METLFEIFLEDPPVKIGGLAALHIKFWLLLRWLSLAAPSDLMSYNIRCHGASFHGFAQSTFSLFLYKEYSDVLACTNEIYDSVEY